MRLVITGASGFIGQKIVPIFAEQGVELLLIGRDAQALALQYPDHSTGDYGTLEEIGKGADALLHLAVLNNDQTGTEKDFHEANVTLLETVLAASRSAQIPCFIYTSSLHAGPPTVGEETTPYARSKAAAEIVLQSVEGLALINLRLPAVYGEGAFKGKLGGLNKLPGRLRSVTFKFFASLKPTVHVSRIADAVLRNATAETSLEEILSDKQNENLFYHGIKMLIDVLFALTILICFWWLLLGVWVAVRFTSQGPGLLTQTRVGRFGKPFRLYKFRTMTQGTKQAGTHEISAASVTSIGHALRRLKIDELPQVINILKGEISLVGPRPCLSVQSELVEARQTRGVFDVMPGITGYAQVRGVDMSDPIRLAELDAQYVQLRSTLLDFKTIVQTVSKGSLQDRINS